jgi:hypothetical protein
MPVQVRRCHGFRARGDCLRLSQREHSAPAKPGLIFGSVRAVTSRAVLAALDRLPRCRGFLSRAVPTDSCTKHSWRWYTPGPSSAAPTPMAFRLGREQCLGPGYTPGRGPFRSVIRTPRDPLRQPVIAPGHGEQRVTDHAARQSTAAAPSHRERLAFTDLEDRRATSSSTGLGWADHRASWAERRPQPSPSADACPSARPCRR